jgi:hypothetical protein
MYEQGFIFELVILILGRRSSLHPTSRANDDKDDEVRSLHNIEFGQELPKTRNIVSTDFDY